LGSNAGRLVVATCQFPVDADVTRNLRYVLRQVKEAASRGAAVVHFPECALSGYAGSDLADLEAMDWDRLERAVGVLAAQHETLRTEVSALRGDLGERNQRIRVLEAQLLEANQRRQDTCKRVDELIAQLDQLDAQLASAEPAE